MKRSELDAALKLVAARLWDDGIERFDRLVSLSRLTRPELCKTIAVEIFVKGLENPEELGDTLLSIHIIRTALQAYHQNGFLEFDPE